MPFTAIDPKSGKTQLVEWFIKNGKKSGICGFCDTYMDIRGENHPTARAHFYHEKDIKCPSTDKNKTPFEGLRAVELDKQAGIIIREKVKENLFTIFLACNKILNKPVFLKDFKIMMSNADKKNIWDYKGITLEHIPYVLLTFHNDLKSYFTGYEGLLHYRVIFETALKSYDDLWNRPHQKLKMLVYEVDKVELLETIEIENDPFEDLEPDTFKSYKSSLKL